MTKYLIILSICLAFGCKEESAPPTSAELLNQMEIINDQIEAMLSTSCSASSQCMVSAFGAKPCGGPWKYIIHSTNMNLQKFRSLLVQYNSLNAQYNEVAGIGSDCSIANKPEVECVSGNCQEVTN
ncbi:MAG: hypothetical protein ABJG47_04175 [Ekhidna sp.]